MKKTTLILASLFVLTFQNKAQTVTDIDGNVYNTVKIGTQTWMKENLRTTKFNDGTVIQNITDATAWANLNNLYSPPAAMCTYNNTSNTDTIRTYGRLYNWYAGDTGKLCPMGWHVPNDAEWTILQNYLIANGYNFDDSPTANNIAKSMATNYGWTASTNSYGDIGNTEFPLKQNASGFSALPGGLRYGGPFMWIGRSGNWWSSTSAGTTNASNYTLSNTSSSLAHNFMSKGGVGYSVRGVKDNASGINDKTLITFNVSINKKQLTVSGITIGETINIYNLQGISIYNQKANAETVSVGLPSNGLYIVKVGATSVKVVL